MRSEIESETDTEEYEKVSQMPCDQQQQCNIEIKVEQIDAEINTDAVELRSVETWTEVNNLVLFVLFVAMASNVQFEIDVNDLSAV